MRVVEISLRVEIRNDIKFSASQKETLIKVHNLPTCVNIILSKSGIWRRTFGDQPPGNAADGAGQGCDDSGNRYACRSGDTAAGGDG